VCDVTLFQRFENTAGLLEGEAFGKFFTPFTESKVVFVEFVGAELIRFMNWALKRKFESGLENLKHWKPPRQGPDDVWEPEQEESEPPPRRYSQAED
jgi:hypothetical protein